MAEKLTDKYGVEMTVYADKIDEEIHAFFSRFASEKVAGNLAALDEFIANSTQQKWSACLMHVGKAVFPDNGVLKINSMHDIRLKNGAIGKAPHNNYDIDIINYLVDIYIYYCSIFDKMVSLYAFAYMVNIPEHVLYQWLYADDREAGVSGSRALIHQKLVGNQEKSLSEILAQGKRNPVAILGILNHYHGWNMPHVSREIGEHTARNVDALPSFGNMHNALTDSQQGETPANGVK